METTPTTQSDSAALETREMMLNIGPAHPAMHGIVRLVAKLQGEQIQEVEVEIGYLHRAFEKMAETVDYNGVVPYMSPPTGSSPRSPVSARMPLGLTVRNSKPRNVRPPM